QGVSGPAVWHLTCYMQSRRRVCGCRFIGNLGLCGVSTGRQVRKDLLEIARKGTQLKISTRPRRAGVEPQDAPPFGGSRNEESPIRSAAVGGNACSAGVRTAERL